MKKLILVFMVMSVSAYAQTSIYADTRKAVLATHADSADYAKYALYSGSSVSETDPIFNSSVAKKITAADTSKWDAKVGTETDPIFIADSNLFYKKTWMNGFLAGKLGLHSTADNSSKLLNKDTSANGIATQTMLRALNRITYSKTITFDSINTGNSPQTDKYLSMYCTLGANQFISDVYVTFVTNFANSDNETDLDFAIIDYNTHETEFIMSLVVGTSSPYSSSGNNYKYIINPYRSVINVSTATLGVHILGTDLTTYTAGKIKIYVIISQL